MSKEQREEFEKIVEPVIKYLNNFHPHMKIIITCTNAEMLEGLMFTINESFIKD